MGTKMLRCVPRHKPIFKSFPTTEKFDKEFAFLEIGK